MSATEASNWVIYSPEPTRGRKCGACKACCIQVPVELPIGNKPANVRCPLLRSKGCGVYEHRPNPCRYFSCRWLFDATTADLIRPDLSGYIVDPMSDHIIADDQPIEVVQIWVDPARPDSHRAPELRAWLAETHKQYGYLAIVRWGEQAGLVLVPPNVGGDHEAWLELSGVGGLVGADDMKERLAALGVERKF